MGRVPAVGECFLQKMVSLYSIRSSLSQLPGIRRNFLTWLHTWDQPNQPIKKQHLGKGVYLSRWHREHFILWWVQEKQVLWVMSLGVFQLQRLCVIPEKAGVQRLSWEIESWRLLPGVGCNDSSNLNAKLEMKLTEVLDNSRVGHWKINEEV